MSSRKAGTAGDRILPVASGMDVGFRIMLTTGVALLLLGLAQGTTGCAVAQVPGPGASATALTSEPPLGAHSRVVRYPDGHAVITRDVHGTDITVQRTPAHLWDHRAWPQSNGAGPRFNDPDMDARFRWRPIERTDHSSSSLRDEYRRRMLERLDGYPDATGTPR
jgi:hypothetical protein